MWISRFGLRWTTCVYCSLMYSSIRPKMGKCAECPPDAPEKRLIKGLCPYHYNKNLLNRARQKRVDTRSLIKEQLNKWFENATEELRRCPYCEECGEYIPAAYFRHATAHVLPKAIFRSVATHPANRLFLGAGCGCHSKFDSAWSNAQEMKVWPKAEKIFLIIYPDIAEEEQRKIPYCLLKLIES